MLKRLIESGVESLDFGKGRDNRMLDYLSVLVLADPLFLSDLMHVFPKSFPSHFTPWSFSTIETLLIWKKAPLTNAFDSCYYA